MNGKMLGFIGLILTTTGLHTLLSQRMMLSPSIGETALEFLLPMNAT